MDYLNCAVQINSTSWFAAYGARFWECDLLSWRILNIPGLAKSPDSKVVMVGCRKGWRSSQPSRKSPGRSALQRSDTPWESLTRLQAGTTVHRFWRRLALRLRMGARRDCTIRDILILPTTSCLARRKTRLGANRRMAIALELGVAPGLISKISATTSHITILEPGIWKSRDNIVPERQ